MHGASFSSRLRRPDNLLGGHWGSCIYQSSTTESATSSSETASSSDINVTASTSSAASSTAVLTLASKTSFSITTTSTAPTPSVCTGTIYLTASGDGRFLTSATRSQEDATALTNKSADRQVYAIQNGTLARPADGKVLYVQNKQLSNNQNAFFESAAFASNYRISCALGSDNALSCSTKVAGTAFLVSTAADDNKVFYGPGNLTDFGPITLTAACLS